MHPNSLLDLNFCFCTLDDINLFKDNLDTKTCNKFTFSCIEISLFEYLNLIIMCTGNK